MNSLNAAALTLALTTSSFALAKDMTMEMGATDRGAPKPSVDDKYDEAFTASMTRMMADMDIKSTGDADKDFVLMMMPHHQGAIDMARVELRYGKDPVLRKLSEDIIKAQEQEIGVMKRWRAKAGD